ncbi:sporulation integral membrane protein YtvI [Oceanobacillus damuensis]|uniref:sporulation integral membrane protein YtvI n=1 Tax=Oceanobacillus damuensis TaxID=937928 RepID=UPI000A027F25|nr:sporulation integral membrane protein YtvI [Oceanobacillus damuensis]
MFLHMTKRHWTLIFLLIILLITILFILPISIPLVLALLTALMLNPLVRLIQQKLKINRKTSVSIVFLLFIILVGVVGTFIVTKSVTQLVIFAESVPSYVNQLNSLYSQWERDLHRYTSDLPIEFVKEITTSIEGSIASISTTIRDFLTLDNIAKIFAKIPDFLINFIVYLIALFLFMLELPILKSNMYGLLRKETAEKVSFMNARLTSVLFGFFKAQFLVSIIILAVSLVGLYLIVPEVALIMSLIIWLIDLVPIIGSIIVLGPWALFLLLTGDTATGIQLAILAVILLAIRRTVEPKVMGQHIGLSPLATLISMFIGLQLFGILGFVIGPVIVIAFTSAKEAGIIKWNTKI